MGLSLFQLSSQSNSWCAPFSEPSNALPSELARGPVILILAAIGGRAETGRTMRPASARNGEPQDTPLPAAGSRTEGRSPRPWLVQCVQSSDHSSEGERVRARELETERERERERLVIERLCNERACLRRPFETFLKVPVRTVGLIQVSKAAMPSGFAALVFGDLKLPARCLRTQ